MDNILNFLENDNIDLSEPDTGLEEWKKKKSKNRARMVAMQNLPYDVKKKRSELRAREFIEQMDIRGKQAHVIYGKDGT